MGPEEFAKQYPDVVAWLRAYTGDFPIYQSFQRQFRANGTLSDKQRACIERAIAKDKKRNFVSANYKPADRLAIKSWLAGKLAEQHRLRVFFRNLEIVKLHKETARAIEVTVKFVSEIATSCHVCGRPLDTDISKACGIGPVCCENIGLERPTLTNAQKIIKDLEGLMREAGEIGPFWLPKSQILQPHEHDDEEARIALLEDDDV